jgi:hypothetical protein
MISDKIKDNNLFGGAEPKSAQANNAKKGKGGDEGAPKANAFNMLPVLFNVFIKILPISLYIGSLLESLLFNDIRGFFIFIGLLLNDAINTGYNYLSSKKDNERCAVIRNRYSEDFFVLPTTHTEYISFITAFLMSSMFFKKVFHYGVFVIFSLLVGITAFNRVSIGCKDFVDAGYSLLIGVFKGIIYYVIVKDFYEPDDVTPEDHWIEKSLKKFLPRSDADDEFI